MEATLNGILNIPDGFVAGLVLRNAPGEHRAFSHEHSVLIRLNQHAEFHAETITAQSAFRNRELLLEKSFCSLRRFISNLQESETNLQRLSATVFAQRLSCVFHLGSRLQVEWEFKNRSYPIDKNVIPNISSAQKRTIDRNGATYSLNVPEGLL